MPRKYQTYTLERKLKCQLGGVNSTNKAQLKKIEKLQITQELEQVPLSEIYAYLNKQWHFKGVSCRFCDTLMTDSRVIDKHRYVCTVYKQKLKQQGLD